MNLKHADCQIRRAAASDSLAIRSLIREVGINPLGLDWRRFILAIDDVDQMVGCGQLKNHGDDSLELASLAVKPEWRGRGVSRIIINALIEQAPPGELYLTCRSGLESFYQRFGFEVADDNTLPQYFRRIQRFSQTARRLRMINESILVMSRRI